MSALDRDSVYEFANQEIAIFHNTRLAVLDKIKLRDVIKKKNPYLFRAKNILTASELIKSMLDARLSSSEEKIFGDFLERLAIFISQQVAYGRKSSAKGIDLEFERDSILYIVAIKSGPDWGNSSQYQSLEANFKTAVKVQRQAQSGLHIQPVLGICYGNTQRVDNGLYLKITGQDFWYFVSGDRDLYIEILEPIGNRAREHNDRFLERQAALENRLSREFTEEFCLPDGQIDWAKLIGFNSGNHK